MKVYVITKGEYSDYHICAVSTNKEKAELLQKAFKGNGSWSEARIETYETDKYITEVESGLKLYRCVMDTAFGITIEESDLDCIEDQDYNVRGYEDMGHYWVYVWAKDEDHARKIAADKIAEYMAKKEGIDASL